MADAIAIARENIDAFNAADWGRFKSTLAADSIYEELATQRRVGVDGAVEASQGWKRAFPDSKGTITKSFASGDDVVLEITWNGTQTGELRGPLGTIPPTGKRVEVKAVQVVKVRGDKIAETRHYFDLMGLLQQVGAVPTPAGAS
jgi:steroid delta-isomerase-like uncharacterized protein